MTKYIFICLGVAILAVPLFLWGGHYDDWSKINRNLEASCRDSEGWRNRCTIDFKNIGFAWDNIFSFDGAEQHGVNSLLGTESVEVKSACEYLAFTRKGAGVIAVYEQCYNEQSHAMFNDFNEVTLRIEIPLDTYEPLNTICEGYIVSKESNSYEVPVRYSLSCGEEFGDSTHRVQ